MRIEVSHQLDLADSIERMQALTAYWREKYAVESRWTKAVSSLAGSFLGTTFQATLSVRQRSVVVEGPDPGILLRRLAIAYVSGKLNEYLCPEMSVATLFALGR